MVYRQLLKESMLNHILSYIIFEIVLVPKVVYTFLLAVDFPTMTTEVTSSTILTQASLTLLPYSIEICHKLHNFELISATIVAAF